MDDKQTLPIPNWRKTFCLVFQVSVRSFLLKKSAWLASLIFALCLLILFPFALGTVVIQRPDVQIGCLWTILEFLAALCIGRMFDAEREAKALDILLSSRSFRSAILFAKLCFTGLLIFSLQIPIVLFWIALFNVPMDNIFIFCENIFLVGFFFSFGSASLGAFIYTMTSQSLSKEILQPILFFPLQTGILLASVSVTLYTNSLHNLSNAFSAQSWWSILILYPFIFMATTWIFSFTLLEE